MRDVLQRRNREEPPRSPQPRDACSLRWIGSDTWTESRSIPHGAGHREECGGHSEDVRRRGGFAKKRWTCCHSSRAIAIAAMIGPGAGQVDAIGTFGERSGGLTNRQVSPVDALKKLRRQPKLPFAVDDDMTGTPIPASALSHNGQPGLGAYGRRPGKVQPTRRSISPPRITPRLTRTERTPGKAR